MKKERIELIKQLVVVVLGASFLVYVFWKGMYLEKQLESEPAYTYGIVVGFFDGRKSDKAIKYLYKVNGEAFYANDNYHPEIEPIRVEIGDTCEVVYARTDPSNSRLSTNYNGTLCIRRSKSN